MRCNSSRFLQYSNLLDMASDKPGEECCLSIHSLRPSNHVDHNIAASWRGQWITWSTVSLSVRNLGKFEWFYSFQRYSHLPTPQIPYEHFYRHRCCHIVRLFAARWNTDMTVSTSEISLLCDDQYFNLRCLDVVFFIVLSKCEVL